MQITVNDAFLIRQYLAWILEKIRYMEVIGDLDDAQASLRSIAPHLHNGHIAVGNNLADEAKREVHSGAKVKVSDATIANMSGEPLWSRSERKFLRNARNRFGTRIQHSRRK